MSYRTELTPPAKAEIRALSGYLRSQALKLISALGEDPRPPRAKELRGQPNLFRIWLAGRWRIVYEVDAENQCVLILRVRTKEQIDYGSVAPWTKRDA